jgi:hypothetical protein
MLHDNWFFTKYILSLRSQLMVIGNPEQSTPNRLPAPPHATTTWAATLSSCHDSTTPVVTRESPFMGKIGYKLATGRKIFRVLSPIRGSHSKLTSQW